MLINPVTSRKNLVARCHKLVGEVLACGRIAITAVSNPIRHCSLWRIVISIMAVTLMAMTFTTKSASADGWLRVMNADHKPVTITFTAGHCYAGNTLNGKIWDNVGPGAFVDISASQDPQGLCDGKGGHFFTPIQQRRGRQENRRIFRR